MKSFLIKLGLISIISTFAMADYYIEYSSFQDAQSAYSAIKERNLSERFNAYVVSDLEDDVYHFYIRIDGFKNEKDAEQVINFNGWNGFAYAMED